MNLKTIQVLSIDEERVVKQGQNIKVFLNNGEILIGKFINSDHSSLKIERKEEDMTLDFEEVSNIDILE